MTDHPTEEHRRGAQSSLDAAGPWKAIGPYLSERGRGSVREDYSADGDAWRYFPYEHGRSRAYRWNEDGLAGLCDIEQRMCFALALWNGRDPFLKERLFGLTGPEGNHGEDVKEYWWYADATPTASWLAWRYVYPHAAFPYDLLRTENARSELPQGWELTSRLDVVLEVLYSIINEGYAAYAGEALVRKELCGEAIYLCGLLVDHPSGKTPKAHALLALMLLQASRLDARTDEYGEMLLLAEQSRALWDHGMIGQRNCWSRSA